MGVLFGGDLVSPKYKQDRTEDLGVVGIANFYLDWIFVMFSNLFVRISAYLLHFSNLCCTFCSSESSFCSYAILHLFGHIYQ